MLPRILIRLRSILFRRRLDGELDHELRLHIEMETRENMRRGMAPDQARREALLAFGGVTQTAELCREHRRLPFFDTLARDLRYAARIAAKSPGFTALAVASLALGIGASVTMFCALNSILLRPLPYRDSDRLVLVREQLAPIAPNAMPAPAPDSLDITRAGIFEESGVFLNRSFDVSSGSDPVRAIGARVSPAVQRLWGIAPLYGRLFNDVEDRPGVHVAILGYDLWRRVTGGDPNIVGKTILVNRVPYQVAGVMPREFVFPPQGIRWEKPAELYVPLALTPDELRVYVDNAAFGILALLKPGASLTQTNSEMENLAHSIQNRWPAGIRQQLPKNLQLHALAFPLKEQVTGGSRRLLLILLASVGLLLLIACANVANMLLARAWARAPEIALRLAIGASRATLLRQLLTENLLLALTGASLGLALARMAISVRASWLPADVPRLQEIHLDWRVFVFAVALTLFTTLLFGLAPAIASTRTNLDTNLRQAGRAYSGRGRGFASALIVAEIALTVLLQAGAGLLIRSLIQLRDRDPGLRPAQVLSVSLSLPGPAYPTDEAVHEFYQKAMQQFEAIPGVLMAGAASTLPFSPKGTHVYTIENHAQSLPVSNAVILGDYFQTMGIALRRGRLFNNDDRAATGRVALINETAAREFFPGQDPLGKRVKWGVLQTPFPWMTIVGVVADVSQDGPDKLVVPQIYEPYMQDNFGTRAMSLVLLARVPPANLVNVLRGTLHDLDPDLPLSRLQTIEQAQRDSLTPRRTTTGLVTSFAIAALLLASVGVYGVMMFLVTQRRREIAVRMALGATRLSILKLVFGRGMLMVAIGSGLGLAASLALGRFTGALFYGVHVIDPIANLSAITILAIVALIALLSPARLASRVDSAYALRED
jgi:predicted permease